MNFTTININSTNDIFLTPYIKNYDNCLFFHITTTGHFWRNSSIISTSILYKNTNETWIKKEWVSEIESDEFDMLEILAKELEPFSTLIGFNSTSFHIPYLEQKYRAYGLPSPFEGKHHIDQLKEIKNIGKQLHISTKLNDLRLFLKLPDDYSEIECIAASAALFQYAEILNGAFSVRKAESIDKECLFHCNTELTFPVDIRIHDDEFYLIGSETELKIKVKTNQNRLKLYYNNYKDYFYLPEEDMVIHKSLASAIHKDKKVKATTDNCFTYVPCSEHFFSNTSSMKKYLVALLQHYRNK